MRFVDTGMLSYLFHREYAMYYCLGYQSCCSCLHAHGHAQTAGIGGRRGADPTDRPTDRHTPHRSIATHITTDTFFPFLFADHHNGHLITSTLVINASALSHSAQLKPTDLSSIITRKRTNRKLTHTGATWDGWINSARQSTGPARTGSTGCPRPPRHARARVQTLPG